MLVDSIYLSGEFQSIGFSLIFFLIQFTALFSICELL